MTDMNLTTTVDVMLQNAIKNGTGLYTGRKIVTFKPGAREVGEARLSAVPGARLANSAQFPSGVDFQQLGDATSLVFSELNIAVVAEPASPGPMSMHLASAGAADSAILAVEPETFVFAIGEDWPSYLRGFAAAAERISHDINRVDRGAPLRTPAEHEEQAAIAAATWGLVATKATGSQFSGAGIKIAILDTGLDLNHPDFQNRVIVQQSFVPGEPSAQDGNGHGTHTTGTACGPKGPTGVPRYGTAFGSQIFTGKVLSSTGGGTTATVLAGMNWAVANRCEVISMSLSADGIPAQVAYTHAGQAALNAGCVMIAAASNASRRPGYISPTGAPGNSPTIISVAAVDANLQIAFFSSGGKVEIAGPGVNVFSSWPMPQSYKTESGTSMATPHVAGAAALWAQSNPALRGRALWSALVQNARALPYPATDVGAGLVQCP